MYRLEKWDEGTQPGQSKYFVPGAINLDYYRYINSWLKVGVNFMYDRIVSEGKTSYYAYYKLAGSATNFEYRSTQSAFVIASHVEFEYLNHQKFKMSSGLSLVHANEKLTNKGGLHYSVNLDGLTYHINLVCFRWGKRQGLTGSLGLGYKGIINLGYFICF